MPTCRRIYCWGALLLVARLGSSPVNAWGTARAVLAPRKALRRGAGLGLRRSVATETTEEKGAPSTGVQRLKSEKVPRDQELAEALRSYRKERRRPLLHLSQLEDDDLREKLLAEDGGWRFQQPRTLAEAAALFFSAGTPRFIVAMLVLSVVARLSFIVAASSSLFVAVPASLPLAASASSSSSSSLFPVADAACALATAAFWVVQEWALHDKLLHSDKEWFGRDIHQMHHDLPYYHMSLDGLGLAAGWFTVAAAAATALTPSLELAATVTATYTLMGLFYEFTHFVSHTKVPLPPLLNNLRRHHMSHHLVSSKYWLAFTVPAIDRAFGTIPQGGAWNVPDHERNNNARG